MANERPSETAEQLVQRFQSGDECVFPQLIEQLASLVRCEVSRMHCNRADVDDLAQEALLGLWSACKRFSCDAGVEFAAYARVCVRHRLLNAVKKLTTPELPQDNDVLFQELERFADLTQGDPSEQLMLREEDAAFLQRLKERLSPMEYAVLTLHLLSYSYEEIASLRSLSVKSVDNALQRIRKKLTRWL